jgi:uncharacterized protein
MLATSPIFLSLFLVSTFVAGLTTGLTGFAAGLVASGVWLQILTPQQTAVLIACYGVVNQSYTVWKLRHAFSFRRIVPFIAGGVIGVPLGTMLVAITNPAGIKLVFGVLLIAYSAYGLFRPAIKPVHSNTTIDSGIGVLNGVLGGLTGLGGVIVTIWVQLRDWPKDVQRSVFQPVIFATMALIVISNAASGAFTVEIGKLFLLGLPALGAGLWVGLRLYGKLNDATFRKAILVLLFLSGGSLLITSLFVQQTLY